MHYTRREAFKVGLFGSAALALPLQRAARADSVLDDRMPSSLLPKPFTLPFKIPPVAIAGLGARRRGLLPHLHQGSQGRDPAGLPDDVWALQRHVPGPDDQGEPGPQGEGAVHQQPAAEAPDAEVHALDVGPPARVGVAAAVRRLRQRHLATRASTRTTTTRTASAARTLWYHDHGVHHTAENVSMGQAGDVPDARRPRAVAAAAARASSTCR